VPENQHKLEAVEQLAQVADDAGLSLIELAIAFVVNHPVRGIPPRHVSGAIRSNLPIAVSGRQPGDRRLLTATTGEPPGRVSGSPSRGVRRQGCR
jgi:hypothetical protein